MTPKRIDDILVLVRIIRTERKRSAFDNRHVVNTVLAEYRAPNGDEYRKKFESYGEPNVPRHGTSKELTEESKQW